MKRALKSLDILKGIAIIMIIIVHNRHFIMQDMTGFRQLINFGQMGVAIFFMVSGMVLCYSWTHQCESCSQKGVHNYLRFVKRRYLRLAPGFLMILLINLLLNILFLDILEYSPGYIMNREPLGLLVNMLFLHGLFPEYINSVFPGGWYIGSTFLLYLLFPILFFLFDKIYQKRKNNVLILPFLLWFVNYLLLKKLAISSDYTIYPSNCSFLYYFFLNQLPCFSMGILLFFQEKDAICRKCPLPISLLFSILFTFLSVYLYLQPDEHRFLFTIIPFLVSIASYWFAIFLLHIEECHSFPSAFQIIIDFVADCGKHSYEMYLMHGFFSWYGIKAFTLALAERGIAYNDLLLYLILLPITILLVYLSSHPLSVLLNKIDSKLRYRVFSIIKKRAL